MPALLPQRFWNDVRRKGASGMADYQVTSLANGCYPGTNILINKLDIRNQSDLDAVESAIVPAKAALWAEDPRTFSFDFAHYCAVHRFLFEDLYEWAGKIRTVDISKKGTPFCPAVQIESTAQAGFSRLQAQNYLRGLNKTAFTNELVDPYERTNELHPFREGNGRMQRVFLSQLTHCAGYELDFTCIDSDDLMIATIQSAGGVDDFLKELFTEMIQD